MELIDKAEVVAEIERKKISFKKDIDDGVYPTYLCALMDFEDFLDTLEVKEVYVSNPQFPHLKDIIDKVFGAGNLESWEYDAEQLVLLAKDEVISRACEAAGIKKPYKDGNQWCILKGENIQEGICGFGDNIEDALVDFLRNIPKIPLEVKEVDLEKEVDDYVNEYFSECDDGVLISDANSMELTLLDITPLAKHFFELGLKTRKGE